MKEFQFKPHQTKAISAIQDALAQNQKHIVVEIAAGCGKSLVLAKTVEMLSRGKPRDVLITKEDYLELRMKNENE